MREAIIKIVSPTILFPIKLSDQFAFGELINFSLSFRLLVRSCTGGLYLSVLFHSYLSSISNCSPLISSLTGLI